MNKSICTLLAIAASVLGCWSARSETNAPMIFHILSEGKFDGGRFIDTPAFPKLGYIASKPDLVVTNLEAVVVEAPPPPALDVTFLSEDAKKFTALTEKAVGKRILVMIGDRPLTAVNVLFPITVATIFIELRNEAEVKKTADDLKRLIKQGAG